MREQRNGGLLDPSDGSVTARQRERRLDEIVSVRRLRRTALRKYARLRTRTIYCF
jgi:hypothetical protein